MARFEDLEVFVRKFLALAGFTATAAIAIAIGCSAPSPDGDSITRGRGSSSGTSGTSSGELDGASSTTSSGGNASCTNHAKVDDRPACDQCARANCCAQIIACDDEPDCDALTKCFDDCKGEVICQYTCSLSHESGASVLQKVSSCAKSKCKTECPDTDIGDGGDPFADAF